MKEKRTLLQSLRRKGKGDTCKREVTDQQHRGDSEPDSPSRANMQQEDMSTSSRGSPSSKISGSPVTSPRKARYSLFRRKSKSTKNKGKAEQDKDLTETNSPTQVGDLEIKASDSLSSKGSPEILKSSHRITGGIQDTMKRNDLPCAQLPTLRNPPMTKRSASTSKALLRFMNTTSQLLENLETEVNQKLDSCSNKIDNLDHKIGLMNSKRRLELSTKVKREEENSTSRTK